MAHQKVYGICEDKCKVQVPQGVGPIVVVTKSDLKVARYSDSVIGLVAQIDYPEGFTAGNCIVLAVKEKWKDDASTNSYTYFAQIISDTEGGVLGPLKTFAVDFEDTTINVFRYYSNEELVGNLCDMDIILYRYQ